jgi:hypothetical protein
MSSRKRSRDVAGLEKKEVRNERVAHLSMEQVEALYCRYLQGEKVASLFEEFSVLAPVNSVLRLLPAIERKDLVCPHCDSVAVQKRSGRNRAANTPYCIGCDHIYPLRPERHCKCGGCAQRFIASLNGEGVEGRVPLGGLTSREKILLLAALSMTRQSETTSFSTLHHKPWHSKLAPTSSYHEKCLAVLLGRRAILVSPNTLPEAVDTYRETCKYQALRWVPNVSVATVSDVALEIEPLMNLIYNDLWRRKPQLDATLVELAYELAEEELVEYVYFRIERLNINFKAERALRNVVKSLLSSSSISNIFSFIWKAVAQADNAFKKKLVNYASHAGNLIPSGIVRAAEYGESKDKRDEYDRPSYSKVCQISQVIYELLLDDFDGAFKIPLPRYIDEIMRPVLEGISTASEIKRSWLDQPL